MRNIGMAENEELCGAVFPSKVTFFPFGIPELSLFLQKRGFSKVQCQIFEGKLSRNCFISLFS